MASTYTELATQATDQYFEALSKVQESVLGSVSSMAANMPKNDAMPAIPVPAGVPTVQEINAMSFAFFEKLLASQKAFADKVLQTPAV